MSDATYQPLIQRREDGDTLAVASGGVLDIESGGYFKIAGVAVTSTAAELNILDGVTATKNELNTLDGGPQACVFTVGTEATNAITVGCQFNDANGTACAVRGGLFAYLSDDANGDSIVATAPDGGVAAGTDGLIIPLVANKAFLVVSESDGDLDVVITETGTKTCYLVVVLPNGKLAASGAITFAA